MPAFDRNRALTLLRDGVGDRLAEFRRGQAEAIEHVVTGAGRLLVVQKTGWGKSFVYFIATKMLRESGMGPTLLVSPLLALMRNQIAAAERMGVNAETINSNNPTRWHEIEEALRHDQIDILLIAPERLANDRFRDGVLAEIAGRISLLVIDEAHCISDWGHDFRPHYRLIERTIRLLPPNLRLLATTATANDRVTDDLAQILGPNLAISRGDLRRPSLALQTIRMPSQAERLAWLADQLPKLEGTGIVYTLTVRDAEQVAAWLRSQGLEVEAYTGETGDRREGLEQALLDNRVKALVATTALGMGYDKPDLAFVIHYQTPGSVVAHGGEDRRSGACPTWNGSLCLGRCRLGTGRAQREISCRPFRRNACWGGCGCRWQMGAGTETGVGNRDSVASTSRTGPELRSSAFGRFGFAVPRCAGQEDGPSRTEDHAEQRSAGPERHWVAGRGAKRYPA